MRNIIKTFALWELLKGLGVTIRTFFRPKITVNYPDHDEVYEGGDAYYMSPGHIPAAETGSEFLQFSPREQVAEIHAHIQANAERLMRQH